MKTNLIILSLLIAAGCGDDKAATTAVTCGSGTTLNATTNECDPAATCGSGTMLQNGMCVPTTATPTYVQVEELARPGVNEVLEISNANLEGFNGFAPSFAGAPAAAVTAITGEAKTVLQALYLGSCLLSGVLGLTEGSSGTGLKPAGQPCVAVGGAIFTNGNPLTGTTLTGAVQTDASAYADRVFSQFIPDVMRIDTTITSSYLSLCGDPTQPKQLLCGGRWLEDDVIDITYNYFLAGAAITISSPAGALGNQARALVSDGVNYSTTVVGHEGTNTLSVPSATNASQGHPAVTQSFPYSALPY